MRTLTLDNPEGLRAVLRSECRDLIGSLSHLDGLLTESKPLPHMQGREIAVKLDDMSSDVQAIIASVEGILGPRPARRRRHER